MSDEQQVIGDQYEEEILALPGRILPKRYRIDKMLSVNPYTAIYRTVFEPEERMVTLRVFRVKLKDENDYQYTRFKQEVKRLMGLKHANIAKLEDLGLTDEGFPYIVMENLIGPTLEEVLVHQNRLEADQVVLIFSQIARAVNFAHQQGILHETLQPSRIVISETETGDAIVRTTGFGLLALHNKLGIPLKTPMQKLQFMGTAAYMSPEQCYEGAEVDGRSDIYSLGCMMYECMSGQVPFLANKETVMQMQLEMDPTPINVLRKDIQFPPRLLNIVERCMLKDPTRRYQFVKDLQADIEQDIDPSERDKTIIPEGIQKAERRVKEGKDSPFKLVGMIVGIAAGLVGLYFGGQYIASNTAKIADNSAWQSKLDAAKQAFKDGKLDEATSNYEAAILEAGKFPAPDMRLAQTQTDLGEFDLTTGRYNLALENLRSALLIEQASKGQESEAAARTLELLSLAELEAGKSKEAESHARTSVNVAEHITGEHTIRLYQSYLALFKALVANKKWDDAKLALDKIGATIGSTNIVLNMEIISGKKQAEALLHQAMKKYPEAEAEFQDVLGSRQEKIGLGSVYCIETMTLLGKLYAVEGKTDKATKLLLSALEAKTKLLGDSPATAELCLQIAQIYNDGKNKTEAEKYYRQAYDLAEKTWGKGKVETLPYVDSMAKFLRASKQISAAEVYEIEALDIRHPERVPKLVKH